MHTASTMHEKLSYLARTTGRAEVEIVAEAMEQGLAELFRQQIADAYLAGDLTRDEAVTELGETAVDSLDYARRAVERDVKWGLGRGTNTSSQTPALHVP